MAEKGFRSGDLSIDLREACRTGFAWALSLDLVKRLTRLIRQRTGTCGLTACWCPHVLDLKGNGPLIARLSCCPGRPSYNHHTYR